MNIIKQVKKIIGNIKFNNDKLKTLFRTVKDYVFKLAEFKKIVVDTFFKVKGNFLKSVSLHINFKSRLTRVLLAFIVLFVVLTSVSATKIIKDKNESQITQESFLHETENRPTEHSYKVSLAMVGDVLIHGGIYVNGYRDNKYDFKYIFKYIKPYIQQHDLAFANQETILGGTEIGLSTYPRFNSPYEIGDALVDTGFNIISTANNHTLDRGEVAIKNSQKYWEGQDVVFSGHNIEDAPRIKVFEKNRIKFAFVAYTTLTNGLHTPVGKEYLVNTYSYKKAKHDIESVRDDVDVVIVSIHWGHEYHDHEWYTQQETAKELSDLGVDIIIGHHPHVLQPITYINDTLVMYSLGNFLSAQLGIDKLIGAIASVEIEKIESEREDVIRISKPEVKLTYHSLDDERRYFIRYLEEFEEFNDKFIEKTNLIHYYLPELLEK